MGKTVFDLYKVKKFFFYFTSFLAFKKFKEYVPPVAGFKIFIGSANEEKGNIKTWNVGIGAQQQFGTT